MWHFGLGKAVGVYFFGLLTGILVTLIVAQIFSLRPGPEGEKAFLYAMICNLFAILVPGILLFFSGRSRNAGEAKDAGHEAIDD